MIVKTIKEYYGTPEGSFIKVSEEYPKFYDGIITSANGDIIKKPNGDSTLVRIPKGICEIFEI